MFQITRCSLARCLVLSPYRGHSGTWGQPQRLLSCCRRRFVVNVIACVIQVACWLFALAPPTRLAHQVSLTCDTHVAHTRHHYECSCIAPIPTCCHLNGYKFQARDGLILFSMFRILTLLTCKKTRCLCNRPPIIRTQHAISTHCCYPKYHEPSLVLFSSPA